MEGAVYIIAGITSSLYASLHPQLLKRNIRVFATTRPESAAAAVPVGVSLITHQEALDTLHQYRCALWLSTHDDAELVGRFTARGLPVLAMGSGAVMSFYLHEQPEDSLNDYQKSKLSLLRVPNIHTLHGDTSIILFGNGGGPLKKPFEWLRRYSVTPKSYLVACIVDWINGSYKTEPKETPIIVCTDWEYTREELKQGPLGEAAKGEPRYQGFHHFQGQHLTHANVKEACDKARIYYGSRDSAGAAGGESAE